MKKLLLLMALAALPMTALATDVVPVTTTARGWMLTPNLFAQGALYRIDKDWSLTPTAESVAGAQYCLYWGTWSEDAQGHLQYEPLFYLSPVGLGLSAGMGETRAVYCVSMGYKYFGASAVWNLGEGKQPLLGIQASIPLDKLTPGLVWDLGGVVKRNFPGVDL